MIITSDDHIVDGFEMDGGAHDAVVGNFATYEDYLDSQVSETDLFYLEDDAIARQLVELGYRGTGETLRRDDFETRKAALEQAHSAKLSRAPRALFSHNKDLSGFPLLASLAEREQMISSGKLTTIIFIRDRNAKGQEVSGYIDYADRLKTEPFDLYFERRRRLMPRASDLSFYNWDTQLSTSNNSPNFQVVTNDVSGLLFKNKRDRKVICVDPKAAPGDNSRRIEMTTHEYIQVVLFDHVTRRKT